MHLRIDADESISPVVEALLERDDDALEVLLWLFLYVACHLSDDYTFN